jgi:hypothetical protein
MSGNGIAVDAASARPTAASVAMSSRGTAVLKTNEQGRETERRRPS